MEVPSQSKYTYKGFVKKVIKLLTKNINWFEIQPETSIFNTKEAIIDVKQFRVIFLYIVNSLKVEESTIINSFILLDDYMKKTSITLNKYNTVLLLLICVIISMKFLEDCILQHKCIALMFGIEKDELKKLEIDFLNSLDYEIFIPKEKFQFYKSIFFRC